MNGTAALEYARERKQFVDGDFSRVRHQQAILVAVLREAGRKDLLTNPVRLDNFLKAHEELVGRREFPRTTPEALADARRLIETKSLIPVGA